MHGGALCDWKIHEAISKISFGTNPVLGSCFSSSKYFSIYPKGISCVHLRVETRARLDFDVDPALFAGNQNLIFEMAS